MKNLKYPSKKWLAGICVAGVLALFLSSCLKDNKNYYNPPVGAVTFIQASPGEPPLNLMLNNNLVNSWPVNFGDDIDYFGAYTGVRTVNINNAATGGQIFSDTIRLNQNLYYSLFLANTSAHPQILLLKDTLNRPAPGMAAVRFINLGPDAPAVDLYIGGTKLVSNKLFMGYSSFVPVTANSTVTLQVDQAGANTILVTLPNTTLNAGFVYTVWLQGLINTTVTGQKLGINIAPNAIFN